MQKVVIYTKVYQVIYKPWFLTCNSLAILAQILKQ